MKIVITTKFQIKNNYGYTFNNNHTESSKEKQNNLIYGLTNEEVIQLSGSLAGLVFFCMFYISWECCGLKEKIILMYSKYNIRLLLLWYG